MSRTSLVAHLPDDTALLRSIIFPTKDFTAENAGVYLKNPSTLISPAATLAAVERALLPLFFVPLLGFRMSQLSFVLSAHTISWVHALG